MRREKYFPLTHAIRVGEQTSIRCGQGELVLYSSRRADPLPGTALVTASVSWDEVGPGQVITAQAAVVKDKGLVKQAYSGRGLEKRWAGCGSRDDPTLGQLASKEFQTLTGLGAYSPRLEVFI